MTAAFTPIILAHTVAAFAAVALGAVVFLRRKGDAVHRLAGRAWVLLMFLTAVSSFWIRSGGGFSWIHGLSVLALVALAGGVFYAISGRLERHRATMRGLYFGGLVLAGMFTLLPQRLLGRALWGALGLA